MRAPSAYLALEEVLLHALVLGLEPRVAVLEARALALRSLELVEVLPLQLRLFELHKGKA